MSSHGSSSHDVPSGGFLIDHVLYEENGNNVIRLCTGNQAARQQMKPFCVTAVQRDLWRGPAQNINILIPIKESPELYMIKLLQNENHLNGILVQSRGSTWGVECVECLDSSFYPFPHCRRMTRNGPCGSCMFMGRPDDCVVRITSDVVNPITEDSDRVSDVLYDGGSRERGEKTVVVVENEAEDEYQEDSQEDFV